MIKLINGDCLVEMKNIPDQSIDMILTDPPYGTTACKWDSIIDLDLMWEQLKRIIKSNGAIVMTGCQPFTTKLIYSNIKMFKYEIIWEKDSVTNPFLAKKQIMKRHENILVFYKKQCVFNPQMELRLEKNKRNNNRKSYKTESKQGIIIKGDNIGNEKYIYPKSIQKFNRCKTRGLHPTQKPIDLMEYLIKTYTNKNEKVLDFTMGSGSTGVACKNLNRSFIGIELDKEYFKIAKDRIKNTPDPNKKKRFKKFKG